MDPKNVVLVPKLGLRESEMEDLVLPHMYVGQVNDTYGVDLNQSKKFKKGKDKWSVRIKKAFDMQGYEWTPGIEHDIKKIIVEVVKKKKIDSIHHEHREIINTFVANLEAHPKLQQYMVESKN